MLLKNVYNARTQNIEGKILDITNLVTNTTLKVRTSEVKGEIPSVTNLATSFALNTKINEVLMVKYLVL